MALRYAKAAGGNWSAASTWSATGSGGSDSAGIPTAADDVIFEAGSGDVSIQGASVCRSLDCTAGAGNYAGTLTHNSSLTLTIGTSTVKAGGVGLKFSAGMSYSLGATTTIAFASTSGTQTTVDFAGKNVGTASFTGAGGSWQLSSSITGTAWSHFSGTLDTNNQAITVGSANGISANTRTLTLGSSIITLTGSGTPWNWSTSTNLIVTANTATVTCAVASITFQLGTANWGGITFVHTGSATCTMNGASTNFSYTRTGTAVKTDVVAFGSNMTINTLTLSGNSRVNRLLCSSTVSGSQRTLTVTTVSLSQVDFVDIAAAGASIPWTSGTPLGDAWNNANITFPASATQYHIGITSTTTNWDDATRWASSSGGVAGTGRIPLPQDDAVLDQASLASGLTVSPNMPRLGRNVDFGGTRTGAIGVSPPGFTVAIYGSFTVASQLSSNWNITTVFAGRGSHTITMGGNRAIGSPTTIVGGTYTLANNLTITTTNTFTLTLGTLDLAGFTLTCGIFAASTQGSARTLANSGASTIVVLNGTANTTIWTAATLTLTGSIGIVVNSSSIQTRTFAGNGLSYDSLTYTVAGSIGSLVITGANTFGTVNFSDISNARTLTLPASQTQIVGNWNVNGTPGKLMSVVSGTPGTRANVAIASGIIAPDYLNLQDVFVTGGATFYAGIHSTDGGNNSGIVWADDPVSSFISDSEITNGSLTRSTLTGAIR